MNEEKFTNKGQIYASARPSYPKELFKYLQDKNVINPQSIVADIGSGTGIFTTQIAPYVDTVYAVEPNEDMRTQAILQFQDYTNIISVDGTAEHTLLKDHSIDCITVAQAFHWFDRSAFRAECSRILNDHGKAVLIWNDRDSQASIIQENYDINATFCPSFKGASSGISFAPESFDDFFRERCELITFSNVYRYDLTAFLERNLSSSYAPSKTDAVYDEYIHALTDLFMKRSVNGYVNYPYLTRCYIGEI